MPGSEKSYRHARMRAEAKAELERAKSDMLNAQLDSMAMVNSQRSLLESQRMAAQQMRNSGLGGLNSSLQSGLGNLQATLGNLPFIDPPASSTRARLAEGCPDCRVDEGEQHKTWCSKRGSIREILQQETDKWLNSSSYV